MAENEQASGEPQKPRIVVDDDWKTQAQAEKKRLAEEVEKKQAAAAAAPAGDKAAGPAGDKAAGPGATEAGAGGGAAAGAPTREAAAQAAQARRLPAASFATHINSLVTQAFMAMGGMEDPRTKQRHLDLDVAKYHIDTLVVLEEKTKGNLTDDEKRLIDQGLYECRLQYVHVAQSVADMAAPGAEFQR